MCTIWTLFVEHLIGFWRLVPIGSTIPVLHSTIYVFDRLAGVPTSRRRAGYAKSANAARNKEGMERAPLFLLLRAFLIALN